MSVVVIDASMTIAWLFHDERTETPQLVLRRVAREGGLAPSLWRLEVANVLRNAVRRRRCDQGYATRCLQRLGRLRIMIDPKTDAHAWGTTRQLSIEHDLTLYDAAYLELAHRRGLPLATTNRALRAAARTLTVELISA